MVSCGGRSSNAQQHSNESSEALKVETKSASQVAGSMESMSESDLNKLSANWKNNFSAQTGFQNLGKPKGSFVERAMTGESLFVLNFECENPSAVCASYAKAIWDLNKGFAEKGELFLYVGGDTKYKPTDNFAQTKYEDSENYTWYYSFGGSVWETKVHVFNKETIKLIFEKK
jgi:hypothetical protein